MITKAELAQKLNVSITTLRRWVKPLKDKGIIVYKKTILSTKDEIIIFWFINGELPKNPEKFDINFDELKKILFCTD